MTRLLTRCFVGLVDHPWLVCLLLISLTAIATVGRCDPAMILNRFDRSDATSERGVPGGNSSSSDPVGVRGGRLQISDNDVALIVHCDDLFSSHGSEAVLAMVERLRSLDVVADLFWMDDVPPINLFALRTAVLPKPSASRHQFDRARERALSHPLIVNQFLSADSRTLLLLIKLDWLFVEGDDETLDQIYQAAFQATSLYPELNMTVQVAGRVPTTLAILKARDQNQRRFIFIALGMVVLLAVVLFRGFVSVLIVALPPVVGVYWVFGTLPLLQMQDNPFNEVVTPVLIGMVGFTDSIHLFLDIRRLRASGLQPKEAAKKGIRRVGMACFLTSLTTAIGLGSLALSENEIVREFGFSCVVGVCQSFLAIMLVIPLACASRLGNKINFASKENVIDVHLSRIGWVVEWSMLRYRTMSLVAIGGTIVLLIVSLQMKPDHHIAMLLPMDSPILHAMDTLDQAMGGTEPASVSIQWTKRVAKGSEEIREVIADAHGLLAHETLIGAPVSLQSFIDVLPGDPNAQGRLSIAELLPPPLKDAFYQPEKRSALIRFKVRDVGIAAYAPVFARIERGLNEIGNRHPGFTLYLSGSPIRRWENLYQVVMDLVFSLGSASVIIFIVLTIAFRSIRLGLIAIIPNTFPLVFTGTCFFLMGQSLEIAAVCAFTVCLGIAVDDTIHFISRYREDRRQRSEHDAIRSAFTSTGSALIMTTMILVLGISSVLISGMREQRMFALITCLTIGSALIGDLLFLPPLLALFAGKERRRNES